jgi:hypothetical protein
MPLPKKGEALPFSKIKEICELTAISPGLAGSILIADLLPGSYISLSVILNMQ